MAEPHAFLKEIRSGVLIGDGAIGTALFSRGAPLQSGVERLNLTAPNIVETLHCDYIAAGSRVIETNTFGANRPNLDRYEAGDSTRDIILEGVRIAKTAAGKRAWVAGSVGPLPPVDGEPLSEAEQERAFAEVIETLLEGGVDILLFETFIDIRQLCLAVRTARSRTDGPVIAQMAFEANGRIAGGESVTNFIKGCAVSGADVIGANCGEGIPAVREAVKRLVGHGVPVSAFMNAGFAERIEERTLFVAPDDYISATAVDIVRLGARLVGGCCGTNPDTIRAIANAVRKASDITFAPAPKITEERKTAVPEAPPAGPPKPPQGILVELDPPKNMDVAPLVDAALSLKEAGVAAVTLADNPLASVRVDVLTIAGILHRETGVAVIPHLTGRDRNRIALQSFVMGAHITGMRSLLCVTGDPVRMYNETNTSGVFDVTSIGLIKLVSEFNEGRRTGDGTPTAFSIGVALNPNVRNIGSQTGKLRRKIEAGAHFALTQPVFTGERLDMLDSELEREGIDIPIFAGVMPLMSARNAEFLHNEVPGIYIPDEYRERLNSFSAKEDQRRAGIEIAVEIAEDAAKRGYDLYLITPRNNTSYVLPVIEAVKAVLAGRKV